ncbi:unnamed protein product [Trichogramma brassicae]|uniref:Integrase zinc-binding domain-containing protein n=1 Tax=Trichogramma brassicae TaxID=86971 RepID=A0A6H5J6W5_9HYME|nr:unnamed protein product [Trichogramma brassicae]
MSDSDVSEFGKEQQEALRRDFEAEGKLIASNLLPSKSRERYEIAYAEFSVWGDKRLPKGSKDKFSKMINENVLLVYFNELAKKIKPPTMWSRWSMLKTILNLRHNIDISKYEQLKSFMKNFSKGYKPKQAKTLTGLEVKKFLDEADDLHYLATKKQNSLISNVRPLCNVVMLLMSEAHAQFQAKNSFLMYKSINKEKKIRTIIRAALATLCSARVCICADRPGDGRNEARKYSFDLLSVGDGNEDDADAVAVARKECAKLSAYCHARHSGNAWQIRRAKRFDVLEVDGVNRLIAKIKPGSCIKYYVPLEDVFDIIQAAHIATGHGGRDRLLKETSINILDRGFFQKPITSTMSSRNMRGLNDIKDIFKRPILYIVYIYNV